MFAILYSLSPPTRAIACQEQIVEMRWSLHRCSTQIVPLYDLNHELHGQAKGFCGVQLLGQTFGTWSFISLILFFEEKLSRQLNIASLQMSRRGVLIGHVHPYFFGCPVQGSTPSFICIFAEALGCFVTQELCQILGNCRTLSSCYIILFFPLFQIEFAYLTLG